MTNDNQRTMIFTRAFVPDDLINSWLQHLRNFDTANPGCHFEVMADTLHIPLEVMVEMLKVNPNFSFTQVFNRDGEMYDIARVVCHNHGMPWTDPRTGVTYPPPPKKADK